MLISGITQSKEGARLLQITRGFINRALNPLASQSIRLRRICNTASPERAGLAHRNLKCYMQTKRDLFKWARRRSSQDSSLIQ